MATSKWVKEREEFQELLDRVGHWNVTAQSYAEQTGVPSKTVQKWLTTYRQSMGPHQIRKLAKELPLMNNSALKMLSRHMTNSDPKISMTASLNFINASKTMAEVLEKWGLKDVIALDTSSVNINVNSDLFEGLSDTQKKDMAKKLEKGPN